MTFLQWAALGAILALAAYLSLRDLKFYPRFDELWHIALSTGRGSAHLTLPRDVLIDPAPSVTATAGAPPVWAIPTHMQTVTHPPLYSMLLRGWRDVFGDSLATARILSAMFFVASIAVLFDAVRILHSPRTALWATALLAVSSAQLQTAQQVRNYSFEVLCITLVIDAVVRLQIFGTTRVRLSALFVASLAAFFSHYFAVFGMVAIGLYVLLGFRGKARIVVAATMFAAFAVYFVLWFPMLLGQREAIDEATLRSPLNTAGEDGVGNGFVRLCLAPMRLLFEPRPLDALAPRLSGVLLVLPWFLVPRRPKLLLWILLLDCCVGGILAMDLARQTKHLAQIRHLIVAGLGLSVLIPAMLEHQKAWPRHGVPAIIVLACIGAMGLPIQNEYRSFEAIGRTTGDERYRNQPIIFYGDPEVLWKSDLSYLAASQFSQSFPRPIVRASHPLDAAMLDQLRRWPGAVLVCNDWQLDSPELKQNATLEMLDSEPYLGCVAHLTWLSSPPPTPSTTQPATSVAPTSPSK